MDSGAEFPDASAFFERLFSSRNRDFATFLPLLLAFANPSNSSNQEENPSTRDQETENNNRITRERLILVNPFNQSMIVIEGSSNNGSGGFDSLIDELFSKGGQPPASKSSMEAMPEVEVGEGDGECVICLEEWETGVLAKEMPCKHRFHSGCIEKWLKIHGTCPVCRYKMPVEEREDGDRKEENGEVRRRRGVWMRFSFGEGSDRRNGEGDQNDSATEASDSVTSSTAGNSDLGS